MKGAHAPTESTAARHPGVPIPSRRRVTVVGSVRRSERAVSLFVRGVAEKLCRMSPIGGCKVGVSGVAAGGNRIVLGGDGDGAADEDNRLRDDVAHRGESEHHPAVGTASVDPVHQEDVDRAADSGEGSGPPITGGGRVPVCDGGDAAAEGESAASMAGGSPRRAPPRPVSGEDNHAHPLADTRDPSSGDGDAAIDVGALSPVIWEGDPVAVYPLTQEVCVLALVWHAVAEDITGKPFEGDITAFLRDELLPLVHDNGYARLGECSIATPQRLCVAALDMLNKFESNDALSAISVARSLLRPEERHMLDLYPPRIEQFWGSWKRCTSRCITPTPKETVLSNSRVFVLGTVCCNTVFSAALTWRMWQDEGLLLPAECPDWRWVEEVDHMGFGLGFSVCEYQRVVAWSAYFTAYNLWRPVDTGPVVGEAEMRAWTATVVNSFEDSDTDDMAATYMLAAMTVVLQLRVIGNDSPYLPTPRTVATMCQRPSPRLRISHTRTRLLAACEHGEHTSPADISVTISRILLSHWQCDSVKCDRVLTPLWTQHALQTLSAVFVPREGRHRVTQQARSADPVTSSLYMVNIPDGLAQVPQPDDCADMDRVMALTVALVYYNPTKAWSPSACGVEASMQQWLQQLEAHRQQTPRCLCKMDLRTHQQSPRLSPTETYGAPWERDRCPVSFKLRKHETKPTSSTRGRIFSLYDDIGSIK